MQFLVSTCGQPTINNVMRNLTLRSGDTARFRCSVDMKCMVSFIHWHHEMTNGSVRLLRTGATQGTPYRYTIRKVTPQDAGFYSCIAGNILGETVSSAYLEISGADTAFSQSCLKYFLLMYVHVFVMNHVVTFHSGWAR
eukprot:TRINITY_DN35200_c0_g1_i1.p1 TRINITY_DN35200_c0_g1~~TRINITY_DN35200_c0_g1_i1.p1  ORF type:complete len:139 (+),score=4.03 TRINITY_DN35200_c0_g1_i1:19-435(+)